MTVVRQILKNPCGKEFLDKKLIVLYTTVKKDNKLDTYDEERTN